MQNTEIRFRWLHASCYEIVLSDGRVITTDPYVLPIEYPNFHAEDYTRPDYVLCTHTHFDHIMDIPVVLSKNTQARLYVGEQGALELGRYYNLLFGQICSLDAGDAIVHNGLQLRAFKGKHSRFRSVNMAPMEWTENVKLAGVKEHNVKNMEALNLVGSVEYTDFLITTPQNFRILLTGGDWEHSIPYEAAQDYAPNLVIRQASNLSSPEAYAQVLAQYHAGYALPHHHEYAERRLGMSMEEFTERTRKELARLGSATQFVNPQQFKWHSFYCGIE